MASEHPREFPTKRCLSCALTVLFCMACRNDAGLAAAELALAVEKATLDAGAIDAVGTTGFLQIGPNSMNSVPREAKLEIDIRDIEAARRDRTVASVLKVSRAPLQLHMGCSRIFWSARGERRAYIPNDARHQTANLQLCLKSLC